MNKGKDRTMQVEFNLCKEKIITMIVTAMSPFSIAHLKKKK